MHPTFVVYIYLLTLASAAKPDGLPPQAMAAQSANRGKGAVKFAPNVVTQTPDTLLSPDQPAVTDPVPDASSADSATPPLVPVPGVDTGNSQSGVVDTIQVSPPSAVNSVTSAGSAPAPASAPPSATGTGSTVSAPVYLPNGASNAAKSLTAGAVTAQATAAKLTKADASNTSGSSGSQPAAGTGAIVARPAEAPNSPVLDDGSSRMVAIGCSVGAVAVLLAMGIAVRKMRAQHGNGTHFGHVRWSDLQISQAKPRQMSTVSAIQPTLPCVEELDDAPAEHYRVPSSIRQSILLPPTSSTGTSLRHSIMLPSASLHADKALPQPLLNRQTFMVEPCDLPSPTELLPRVPDIMQTPRFLSQ